MSHVKPDQHQPEIPEIKDFPIDRLSMNRYNMRGIRGVCKGEMLTGFKRFIFKIRPIFGAVFLILASWVLVIGCGTGPVKPTETPQSKAPAVATPKPSPKPQPSWADFDRGAKLYTAGHYAEAWAVLSALEPMQLAPRQNQLYNFLAGVTAYRLGRFADVEKYLAKTQSIPSSLTDYSLYYRGMAALSVSEHEKARTLLAQYITNQPAGPFVRSAQIARAEALYHDGKPEAALKECQRIRGNDPGGHVSLAMARMYEGMGRAETARSYYQQAMENSRVREVRAEASIKYRELLDPMMDQPGNEALKLDMVRFLRREWRLDESLKLIDRLERAGGNDEFLSRLGTEKALLLYFSGQNEEALSCYQGAQSASGLRMLARCQRRLGRWEQAADMYLKAATAYGASGNGDQARFDAGVMFLRAGKMDKAQEAWASMRKHAQTGKFKDDMQWRLAFHYLLKDDYQKAADGFRELLKESPDSKLTTAATYWLARSLEQAGKQSEARPLYVKLARSKQDLYYRMRSEHRLGWVKKQDHWPDLPVFYHLLTQPSTGQDFSVIPLSYHGTESIGKKVWANSDPGLNLGDLWTERKRAAGLSEIPGANSLINRSIMRVRDLAAAGTMDLAHIEAEETRDLIKKTGLPNSSAASDLHTRLLALSSSYMADSGDYDGFVRLQYKYYRTLVSGRSEDQKQLAQRRFYPLAYPGQVLSGAKEFHLHPALLLAVMRTESYYQPDILSVANARGLMQILPSTGRKISACMNLAPPHPEALFDPDTNIRLGAWYISALTKEFGGQYPLAIASYNGGPFNVKRWVSQAEDNITMEEFIETIPFNQTRIYVKKILGTMYRYRLLFAATAQSPDLAVTLRKDYRDEVNF
jgi:soluble lytic murein transglycosylase